MELRLLNDFADGEAHEAVDLFIGSIAVMLEEAKSPATSPESK